MDLKRTLLAALLLALLVAIPGMAQDQKKESEFSFGLGLGLGVANFTNPGFPGTNQPELLTYQSLGLNPDIAYGKFGLGLGFILNYRFNGGNDNNQFEVRKEDWVVGSFQEFMEVYLAKFRYVRWGKKGEALFAKLGTIDDALLGNGFIMANYSNALYLPERRIFGLSFDLDGKLFEFPYLGVETFVGNLAVFDVIGARLYVRPLMDLQLPILKELQVGLTVAADRDPYYFVKKDPQFTGSAPSDAQVLVYGADFRLPILSGDLVSLAAFGDLVNQKKSMGGMLGFGGRFFGFLTYGAQARFLGDNFVPSYFGAAYDSFRPMLYRYYNGDDVKKGMIGWFASLGFSALGDKIVFDASMDGPFGSAEGNFYNWRAVFAVKEGILPGFFFDASYDKLNMSGLADFQRWQENAVMRARINYKTGPAVISLVYNLRYDPVERTWKVTSGLESAIALF